MAKIEYKNSNEILTQALEAIGYWTTMPQEDWVRLYPELSQELSGKHEFVDIAGIISRFARTALAKARGEAV